MKLNLEGIGDVTFVKNQRSRSLRIIVKPFTGVKVTLPGNISYQSAIAFVNTKKGWIQQSLDKMKQIENKAEVYTEKTLFQTKYHQLAIQKHNRPDFHIKRGKGVFSIFYPVQLDVQSEKVQETIKKGILWLLRKEAKSYLPFRVMHLAEKHGFRYERVYVKNLKTRWGSCSYTNNINLNIHLMRLPDHLIDYVILHELVHTIHKDHSVNFWRTLDTYCINSKDLRLEMRNYTTTL